MSRELRAVEDESPFATIEEAIEDIREGKFVVVVDAPDRENEGDLTIAAQFCTPEAVNFMATHARGLICLCLTEERCDELALRMMTDRNETPFGTAFTVSIEAREGISTGISAHDRSRTIQVAVDPSQGADALVQPGHVFPLRARRGGVLERTGQTEAAVDLARLAGLQPAGVVCEVMKDDGTMARVGSECLTGDVFHSLRCDCGEQLTQALERIEAEGRGVLLYMAQEGRGIGLLNKLRAYELQEQGRDTVEANLELGFPADARDYGIGNQILADLGLTTIRILTNNPKKLTGIDGFGLTVVEQVPIETRPNDENRRYLTAKRDKLGHRLHHQDLKNLEYEEP